MRPFSPTPPTRPRRREHRARAIHHRRPRVDARPRPRRQIQRVERRRRVDGVQHALLDFLERLHEAPVHEHRMAREPGGVGPSRPRRRARSFNHYAREPRHVTAVHIKNNELLVALINRPSTGPPAPLSATPPKTTSCRSWSSAEWPRRAVNGLSIASSRHCASCVVQEPGVAKVDERGLAVRRAVVRAAAALVLTRRCRLLSRNGSSGPGALCCLQLVEGDSHHLFCSASRHPVRGLFLILAVFRAVHGCENCNPKPAGSVRPVLAPVTH